MPTENTVTKIVEVPGTEKVGLGQIGNHTPSWATWVFRIFFYLYSFATIFLTMDPSIPKDFVIQFVKYGAITVMLIHGLGKLIGVDTKQIQTEATDAFKP
jgi:hypothetical protein